VAAIGIKLRSSWVTMHGVSVNVRPDMRYFDNIVPCGISDRAVGSLSHFVSGITTEEVATELVRRFGEVFEVQLEKEGDGGEDEAERYLNSLPADVVT
jgi:lipoyl(octanoyl) transferase